MKTHEKGYLHAVALTVSVILLLLLALSWLPPIHVGEWQMRRVDLLADLRPDSVEAESLVSAPMSTQSTRARVDTCRAGLTCINEFSDAEERGMSPLYRALDSVATLGRPVRIAVLGDSYIEGDILTGHLRELLQQRYGGCGVGFLPITSNTAGFRISVRQTFSNWESHNANDTHGYENQWANLTGHYFRAHAGDWVRVNGVSSHYAHLDTCQRSTLYYMGSGAATVTATVNGGGRRQFDIYANGSVGSVSVDGAIGSVSWRVERADAGVRFLGVAMDGDKGVAVDNFSLRSASGIHLSGIRDEVLAGFDRERHYDLVVIMYGLNVAGRRSSDYTSYRGQMTRAIEHMKSNMPQTGFLVVSVGDREEKRGGQMRTMRGVLSLVNAQQTIAYDSRVAFWNLYTAMGGEGSIVKMVNAKPPQANLDYTHINFRGGKHLAGLLFDAIAWGHEQHNRQSASYP